MNGQSKAWLYSAAAVIVFIAYLAFFEALVRVSSKNPYAGHVIFVPLFAAVLFWLERHRLRGFAGRGSVSGAVLTALALTLLAIAYRAASVPLQALSFVAAVAGLGLWVYGRGGLRRVAFVLAFLLLMVPPPRDAVSAIAPGIQHAVAVFSGFVLHGLQIPVEQQGIFLRFPGLTLEVAEECAGLRFSLILFVSVSAFARAVLPTISSQLVLMLLAVPVAMLANATRVAATSVGAYVIGPEVVTGPLHYYIGKSFWALAFMAMIGFAWLLRSRIGHAAGERCSRPDPFVAEAS
jgi:exosortase